MKQTGPIFPLFNRVAVFVMSSVSLIGMAVGLANPANRNDLDIATGLFFLMFALIFSFGIWISLNWRNRGPEEMIEVLSADRPPIPDDAIVSSFFTGFKSALIAVDRSSAVIHFENCHVPRQFLAKAQTWFSCPISEVTAVHRFLYRGESLTIVTATGKALVPATATNYLKLLEFLTAIIPANKPGFATDNPMMGIVNVAGALVGLFGGVFLAPLGSNESTQWLFGLVGAFLGVAGGHLLIRLGDRWLKTGLVNPIAYSMVGFFYGLVATSMIAPFVNWNLAPMLAIVMTGGILGVVVGINRFPKK